MAAVAAVGDVRTPFVSANVGLFGIDSGITPRFRVVEAGGMRIGITSIVGDNEAAIAEMLLQRIKESGATRVVMAGASAGGFAAMRFGPQCGADVVIAFSPQAFIGASARAQAGDERWPEQIAALHAALGSESPQYQVREILETAAGSGMETQVHFSAGDALDARHAEALSGVSGVTLTAHPGDDHKLVKQLRNQGMLAPMLLGALRVD